MVRKLRLVEQLVGKEPGSKQRPPDPSLPPARESWPLSVVYTRAVGNGGQTGKPRETPGLFFYGLEKALGYGLSG